MNSMAHPKRRGRSDADIGDAGVDQQEQDREVEVEGFEHPLVDDDDRGPERKKNGVKKRGIKRGKKKREKKKGKKRREEHARHSDGRTTQLPGRKWVPEGKAIPDVNGGEVRTWTLCRF